MMVETCRYVVRASWERDKLAESKGAVRVDRPDESAVLLFPREDVRFDLFTCHGGDPVPDPVGGTAELWSFRAAGPSVEAGEGGAEGRGVLRTFPAPPSDRSWLSTMAAFDHDRVRVELVDPGGGDASDVTVKRFPNWGDARHLIDLLDVGHVAEGAYESTVRPERRRPVVEGSQMLGQAIVAAGRAVPGRRPVSASMMFLRGADAAVPLRFELEELSAGRTFTGLGVRVTQAGRLCAAGSLLLDAMAADVVRHGVPPPSVTGPYESVPFDMGVTGRDIRVVDGAYDDDPGAPVGPPVIDAWVRFAEVPDDPVVHRGLLAQFTGHMSIAAALRPHAGRGQAQAHRTLSTAVNAISLSFHREVRADRWILYRHRSTFAGDGMTHTECRAHDEEGALVASFSVDAMVRAFADRSGPIDERTAL